MAGERFCAPNPSMAMAAAPPRVPDVTGCSEEGQQGFPARITERAKQIWDRIYSDETLLPETVLTFLYAIEKAEQYFAVKDYVRGLSTVMEKNCVPDYVRDDTENKLENDDKYDKLDHEDIVHALNAVNLEVQPQNASLYFRYKNPNPDHEALRPEERIDFYLDIPVCHLVYEARTKGLFNLCDRWFKENTLTFSGNTLDKEDIKTTLSKCGKIEHVKLNSLKKLAHVTFRDLAGATEAVTLAIEGLLVLGGEPAKLILTSFNVSQYCCPLGMEEDPDKDPWEFRACFLEFLKKNEPHIQVAEESLAEVLEELLREALCRYIVMVREKGKAKGKAKRREARKVICVS